MSSMLEKKEKKFLVKFIMHVGMFAAVVGLSVILNETNDLSIYGKGFLAMSPIVPMVLLLRIIVNHYRSLDEYIQKIMGESLLWAVGVVGCGTMAYGLLAEMVNVPNFSPAYVLPAIAVVFGIAQSFLLVSNNHEE